jgi:IPT/TIG domain-containing protein
MRSHTRHWAVAGPVRLLAAGGCVSICSCAADLVTQRPALTPAVIQTPAMASAPRVFYTDVVAGPVQGGENGNGTYVSIFGKNFGADASHLQVYFGTALVAAVRYFGPSKGRPDVQQITVQPGAAVGRGTVPITVVVDGVASNNDTTFLVNPGDILYVDNATGNDGSAAKNDPARPWRYVQRGTDGTGALGAAEPGDTIVLRAGTWADRALDGTFVRFWRASGSAPTGALRTGYIALTAYPGEAVTIHAGAGGGVWGPGLALCGMAAGKYISISNLTIVSAAHSRSDGAPINLQSCADGWRVVNNDLSWPDASAGMKAGGIAGNGTNVAVVGNHIHEIAGGRENHGIYFDSGARNVDIAYNHIEKVAEGNLLQTFDNLGNSDLTGFSIHHNSLHDGGRYGLNISDGTVTVHAWNNVIFNTKYAGIRTNVDGHRVVDALFEHNTLVNVCTDHTTEPGAIENTWSATAGKITYRFNIIARTGGVSACPRGYDNDAKDTVVSLSTNLYSGYAAPDRDTQSILGDPLFVDSARSDFRLDAASPAVNAAIGSRVADDYAMTPRAHAALGALAD